MHRLAWVHSRFHNPVWSLGISTFQLCQHFWSGIMQFCLLHGEAFAESQYSRKHQSYSLPHYGMQLCQWMLFCRLMCVFVIGQLAGGIFFTYLLAGCPIACGSLQIYTSHFGDIRSRRFQRQEIRFSLHDCRRAPFSSPTCLLTPLFALELPPVLA